MKKIKVLGLACLLAAGGAQAEYTLTVTQIGADFVAVGRGTLNTKALKGPYQTTNVVPSFAAGYGVMVTGQPEVAVMYQGISGPSGHRAVGIAPGYYYPTCSDGDMVGIDIDRGILVPAGYISGDYLESKSTWIRTSMFNYVGLVAGTFTWTWGSGSDADSFTFIVERDSAFADQSEDFYDHYAAIARDCKGYPIINPGAQFGGSARGAARTALESGYYIN